MSYLGIDFDSHAAHCVLLHEDGSAAYMPFGFEGADAFSRLRSVRSAMPSRGYWQDAGVIACGIEEPQGVAKSTVALLKGFQGGILACMPEWLLVEPMEPARWRREVGLAGNAGKLEVLGYVHGCLLGREAKGDPDYVMPWPQDACDAYCLALAVSKLAEGVEAA